jgi:spermidine synthase
LRNSTPKRNYPAKVFPLIIICFVLSGATGLIYEVLWARMLGLVFGTTTLAISAVLCAFMAGLALGSSIAGRSAARLKRPVAVYGTIEIAVGVFAVMVPALFRVVDWAYAGIWQHWHPGFYALESTRFVIAALMLILPTGLMGATLPVLAVAADRSDARASRGLSKLYAGNLAGAIIGTVIAGFVLLPILGITKTIWLSALINVTIGVGCLLIDRNAFASATAAAESVTDQRFPPAISTAAHKFWLSCAFVSGLITIGMQLVWSRLLTMIVGSSTYAFSIVLALFLGGLTIGAFAMGRIKLSELAALRQLVLRIEIATAVSLFVSVMLVNAMPDLLIRAGFFFHVNSWGALLALQAVAATIIVLMPAILMGTILPLVLLNAQLNRSPSTVNPPGASDFAKFVGFSYALNTIGAIIGSIVTAFILIPKVGSRLTIFLFAAICIIIAGVAYEPPRSADRVVRRSFAAGATALLIILAFAVWPRLSVEGLSIGAYDSFVRVLGKSRGGIPTEEEYAAGEHQLLMFDEGRSATVSVRKDWKITSLAINGRTNASDAEDMPTQIMLGQLGVLNAPRLNNALVVGFATGVTAGAMLQSPIQSVECVEIEPAAVTASRFFEHVNEHPLQDQRLHVVIEDARTYLKLSQSSYDLIVSEPSHPWVPGVANLFTREFFAFGSNRLYEDGIFVQWLQTYQLSTESLRTVIATFHSVFPHMMVFRVAGPARGKDLILLGSRTALGLNLVQQRISDPHIAQEIARAGLKGMDDLQNNWLICDETQLTTALGGARINSDDNMLVETRAPRDAFRATIEANAAWIDGLKMTRTK